MDQEFYLSFLGSILLSAVVNVWLTFMHFVVRFKADVRHALPRALCEQRVATVDHPISQDITTGQDVFCMDI